MPDPVYWRPASGCNSIGLILFHMARSEDSMMQARLKEEPEISARDAARYGQVVIGSFRLYSIPLQGGESIPVIGRVTKSHFCDSGTLHVEADVLFIGHSDTAQYLYRFIGYQYVGI